MKTNESNAGRGIVNRIYTVARSIFRKPPIKDIQMGSEVNGNTTEWMDSEEVAAYLGISLRTLTRYRKTKSLTYCIVGRKAFYRVKDVDKAFSSSMKGRKRYSKNELDSLLKAYRDGSIPGNRIKRDGRRK